MARFATHTEGGNWLGGGTTIQHCSPERQAEINRAFGAIMNSNCMDCVPEMRSRMRRVWDNDVEVDCRGDRCVPGNMGARDGTRIWLCDNMRTPLNCALLWHVSMAAGGTLLDAAAAVFLCGCQDAAVRAVVTDRNDIRSGTRDFGGPSQREGTWVILDSNTGEIFERVPGGGWLSGPTARRPACITVLDLRHRYT